MTHSTPTVLIWLLCLAFFLPSMAAAQEHQAVPSQESQETSLLDQDLQLEEAIFEANGAPLYVLNARARVKNIGTRGYRGITVHFFCRLDSSQEWTFIGQRPMPGIRPGDSVTCDLVTSSQELPIIDSQGEVSHGLYRIEIHYRDEMTARDGEFHPTCLHEH